MEWVGEGHGPGKAEPGPGGWMGSQVSSLKNAHHVQFTLRKENSNGNESWPGTQEQTAV